MKHPITIPRLAAAIFCVVGGAWLCWLMVVSNEAGLHNAALRGDAFGPLNTLFAGLAFAWSFLALFKQHQDGLEADERHNEGVRAQERIARIQGYTSLLNFDQRNMDRLQSILNFSKLLYDAAHPVAKRWAGEDFTELQTRFEEMLAKGIHLASSYDYYFLNKTLGDALKSRRSYLEGKGSGGDRKNALAELNRTFKTLLTHIGEMQVVAERNISDCEEAMGKYRDLLSAEIAASNQQRCPATASSPSEPKADPAS